MRQNAHERIDDFLLLPLTLESLLFLFQSRFFGALLLLAPDSLLFGLDGERITGVPLSIQRGECGILLPQLCKPFFGFGDIDVIYEVERCGSA